MAEAHQQTHNSHVHVHVHVHPSMIQCTLKSFLVEKGKKAYGNQISGLFVVDMKWNPSNQCENWCTGDTLSIRGWMSVSVYFGPYCEIGTLVQVNEWIANTLNLLLECIVICNGVWYFVFVHIYIYVCVIFEWDRVSEWMIVCICFFMRRFDPI